MFKTQLVDARNPIDLECAEESPYRGELDPFIIRLAVEWALTVGWEEGRFNASEVDRFGVAVWHNDVLIGVYAMDAEEVCPRWLNLTEWPF